MDQDQSQYQPQRRVLADLNCNFSARGNKVITVMDPSEQAAAVAVSVRDIMDLAINGGIPARGAESPQPEEVQGEEIQDARPTTPLIGERKRAHDSTATSETPEKKNGRIQSAGASYLATGVMHVMPTTQDLLDRTHEVAQVRAFQESMKVLDDMANEFVQHDREENIQNLVQSVKALNRYLIKYNIESVVNIDSGEYQSKIDDVVKEINATLYSLESELEMQRNIVNMIWPMDSNFNDSVKKLKEKQVEQYEELIEKLESNIEECNSELDYLKTIAEELDDLMAYFLDNEGTSREINDAEREIEMDVTDSQPRIYRANSDIIEDFDDEE